VEISVPHDLQKIRGQLIVWSKDIVDKAAVRHSFPERSHEKAGDIDVIIGALKRFFVDGLGAVEVEKKPGSVSSRIRRKT
jgi:hypothetical protein